MLFDFFLLKSVNVFPEYRWVRLLRFFSSLPPCPHFSLSSLAYAHTQGVPLQLSLTKKGKRRRNRSKKRLFPFLFLFPLCWCIIFRFLSFVVGRRKFIKMKSSFSPPYFSHNEQFSSGLFLKKGLCGTTPPLFKKIYGRRRGEGRRI